MFIRMKGPFNRSEWDTGAPSTDMVIFGRPMFYGAPASPRSFNWIERNITVLRDDFQPCEGTRSPTEDESVEGTRTK